jgi:autotransporter-associated beta strand protein
VNAGGTLALNGMTIAGGSVSLNGGSLATTGANAIAGLTSGVGSANVGGTLTVNGTFKTNPSASLTKTGAGTLVIAGAQNHATGAALTHSAGTLVMNSNAGDLTTANLQLNSAATTDFNASQNLRGLSITGGVTQLAHTASGPTKSIKTKSLSVSGGGTLDLTNNRLIVDYTGASELGSWSGGSYTKILGLLQTGRNGGAWDGTGIITSETQAGEGLEYTMLAAAEASQVLGISGTTTAMWGDQAVDATSVLVKYTYGGDATLDGVIDIDDYSRIDLGELLNLRGYSNGDFNLDGWIDVDDYGMIDFTVTNQGGGIDAGPGAGVVGMAVNAVPEPGSVGLLLAGASKLLRRRRR